MSHSHDYSFFEYLVSRICSLEIENPNCVNISCLVGIVAVSCGENLSFDDRVDLSTVLLRKQSLILIWSFTDPIHPVLFLEAPDSILCFRYVRHSTIIVLYRI